MCTLVLLRRPKHAWPLILAANRDEMLSRPWKPPARHWPDRPEVVAGRDELAGGTWMGLNDTGVVACILNRHGSLGPQAGKRSRGELVLEALDHADADAAAGAMADLDARAYRSFNMVIADNRDAWWLALREGANRISLARIPDGLSMFTARERNDPADRRIAKFLPQFMSAAAPEPDANDWAAWAKLMGATDGANSPHDAMSFKTESGFGTSSSSLLALPCVDAAFRHKKRPVWLFAAGAPDSAMFEPLTLAV
ncbi:MAG: NRDE family protein [Rhodospirillaceae bacterium]|nr:NRDE family protein [Rhodospirillaceae bacterium]